MYTVRHLRILNNTPCVPLAPSSHHPKNCIAFLFFGGGWGGGANKVRYGRCENIEF